MKKSFFLGVALAGLVAAGPTQAFTYIKPLPGPTLIPVDAMAAEPWKPGDEVKVAQVGFGGMFPGPGTVHSAGSSYSGPGDVVGSAVGWWGLRAYSAAYAASLGNAVEICLPSAGACTVIHVTSTGGLNTSEIASAGCDSIDTCTIKTLYDQSGNGHNCVQATEVDRPRFYPNGVSTGKPAMVNYFQDYLSCSSVASTSVPFTFVTVHAMDGTPGGNDRVFTSSDPVGILNDTSLRYVLYANNFATSSVTTSTGTFYAVIGATDGTGTGAVVSVSGTTTSSLNASNGSAGGSAEFWNNSSTPGKTTEGGLWGSKFSGGDITSMNSNMQTYWGI